MPKNATTAVCCTYCYWAPTKKPAAAPQPASRSEPGLQYGQFRIGLLVVSPAFSTVGSEPDRHGTLDAFRGPGGALLTSVGPPGCPGGALVVPWMHFGVQAELS